MGVTKRMLEHREYQRNVANRIACEAGCLKECEYHEGVLIKQCSDPTDAYRVGNSKFTKGEIDDVFDTRKEMTDEIKAAIEEAADECYICVRNFGPS